MFFLARSALCIGVVAAMLPDDGRPTVLAVSPGTVPAVSSNTQSVTPRQAARERWQPDQAGRFALAKLSNVLASQEAFSSARARAAREAVVRFGVQAMLEGAARE